MRTALSLGIGYGQALVAAFQFLTRLPIPFRFEYTETICRRSVIFYPLVGAVIGLLLSFAGAGLLHIVPVLPAACLLLVLWVGLTGGLHLDGLMDTADGILSHRPREQMLEIMKDSRVGAMGVIVCVLQLLLKFALLYALLSSAKWPAASLLLAVVPIWSRWFMSVGIQGWPYARRESGMGSFYQSVGLKHVYAGLVLGMALTAAWMWAGNQIIPDIPNEWPAIQGLAWQYIAAFPLLTFCCGYGIAAYLAHKLGGLTGDTYGALNELLETVLLLAVILLFH
ncbi:adenosylcobinamide-GDP ribazoletransferase [Paenibacillus sp. GP183]|jgi:adenosylcobinamide-GDP ribazoletransferase|uniref:adenosylcobinamide-GDP ribazoletransferase n=1 Tax=Paenibacillus sp. GP183 TaxID=1882751 RepID=UPI00089C76B1|nr:adenosylcobinamide-GDP ribazoletransferase [Paenibacillus sp. GP183]SEB96500.1 cobalamin-5'-phosphate synthase [Paenibacillus sp. GP183]